ncbi:MAG: toprim domain-containing protein, partial [Myxococcota bacterium]
LFIVEGDSAGGSAKQGRSRKNQAILPLRGKILNVEKARFDRMLGSEAITTLITALGTSIGDDEFDIAKLRYHKVIIMTDADVDGSHIRTLLLTFFYRHMAEVLKRGYLYIAQPPLFKVTRNKHDLYLKDQPAMDAYLLDIATQKVTLLVNGEGAGRLEGAALKELCQSVLAYEQLLEKVDKRRDARLVDAIVQETELGPESLKKADLGADRERIEAFLARNHADALPLQMEVQDDPEHQSRRWRFSTRQLGTPRQSVVDAAFFENPDFLELRALGEKFTVAGAPPYLLSYEDEVVEVPELRAAVHRIMEEARRGIAIQRYKGLGEMNPEQLWETTMNPATRTLLNVRVDDTVAADDIFTVLMGDQVEPRREFIERHALDVRNLDI